MVNTYRCVSSEEDTTLWRLLELGAIDGYTMTNLYEAVGMAVGDGSSPTIS